MKSKHVKSEMRRPKEPLDFPQDKKAQAKLKKIPKNKTEDNNEYYTPTEYAKRTRAAHKPDVKPKYTKRDKKVGRTIYD